MKDRDLSWTLSAVENNDNRDRGSARSRARTELDFVCTGSFFSRFGLPWFSSVGECLWVINVEAHVAHCRMENATTRNIKKYIEHALFSLGTRGGGCLCL